MNKFTFQIDTHIIFEPKAIQKTGEIISSKYERRIGVIITDDGIISTGLIKDLEISLRKAGIDYVVFSDVEPNPRDITIANATDIVKKTGAGLIIGFGGGSSLDVAKGAAVLATNGGIINDYAGRGKVKVAPLPVVAIPTTAGTGSEVTGNISFTDSAKKNKLSCQSPLNLPTLAILDPWLLRTIPKKVAAACGIDALTHAVEGYISNRANPITDSLALGAINLIGKHLRSFIRNPNDIEHASSMLIASTLAGIVVSSAGAGNVHGIARPLGGRFDVPRGLACAVLFAPVLQFNAVVVQEKLACVASALGLTEKLPIDKAANISVTLVRELCDDIGIPNSLSDLGIKRENIPEIAKMAIANTGPNPRETKYEDIVAILEAAFY